MYCDEIKGIITEYLNKQFAEYAIMIDGDWGSGKTYFIKEFLAEIAKEDNNNRNKHKIAYVSLYGATSIEEVSKAIFAQCFGKRNERKIRNAGVAFETTSNIASMFSAINIDFSEVQKTLVKNRIKNWIICFDDFERCGIPLNEVLGYINGLVEHNQCKVIILANEKEIGNIYLTSKQEEKYQVALLAYKFNNEENKTGSVSQNEELNLDRLQDMTDQIFREDILYKSICEKVIGLTIRFEAKLCEVYNSFAHSYNNKNFERYLEDHKDKILQYFDESRCSNLRTLRVVLDNIKKIYDEMNLNFQISAPSEEYFNQALEEFLEYIVRFTIYYKNGENVSKLGLTSDMGNVQFGYNFFEITRGFKFLEIYCMTLNFSKDDFERVLSSLYLEYEEEEKKRKNLREGLAHTYDDLLYWWDEEDDEVREQIIQLKEEILQDKYPFSKYQGIIGLLLILEKYGFKVGDMDKLILMMNQNIEHADEVIDLERTSFGFQDDELLRERYDDYVGNLINLAEEKKRSLQSKEVLQMLQSEGWAEDLLQYCKENYLRFYSRHGFIDLLDLDVFIDKIMSASTKELNNIREVFDVVYNVSNINDFFLHDRKKLEELCNALNETTLPEITKTLAKNRIIDLLKDIILRINR